MLTNSIDVTRVSWRSACVLGFFVVAIAGCGETQGNSGGGAAGTGGDAGSGGGGGGGAAGTGGDAGSAGMGGSGVACEGNVCACTEAGIRAAIKAGGGPFTFDCDGAQTVVTEAEIFIDNDVILDGEGNLTVDGNQDHRVFLVAEGATAELRGFLVTGGNGGEGGGILNPGTLTLTNSTVSDNTAESGGGIANDQQGDLTLTNSTVTGNSADLGGGIYNAGFSIGFGGGQLGTVTLTNSTVSGNTATGSGGGIANGGGNATDGGNLTLTNSTVSGNTAEGDSGGGIYNSRTLTLIRSTVSGNSAEYGGGIVSVGWMTLTDSTVTGNSASYEGGGIANSGTLLTLTNSTVSGNTAELDGGGGISNFGTLTLTNSTVSGNTAELDGGGGIANFGTLTLTNTLVDNDCDGTALSGGGNLESPGNTCGLDQPTDVTEVTAEDLKLAPLQDNGGPTQTHALLPGSVAIDLIPEAMCVMETDQRGVARPQGAACDVGAFELQ